MILLLLFQFLFSSAVPQKKLEKHEESPIDLEANNLILEEDTLIAYPDVYAKQKIGQINRTFRADFLTFNRINKVATLIGNAKLEDEFGNKYNASYVRTKSDFSEIDACNVQILFDKHISYTTKKFSRTEKNNGIKDNKAKNSKIENNKIKNKNNGKKDNKNDNKANNKTDNKKKNKNNDEKQEYGYLENFEDASYTPCNFCKTSLPFWSIKSRSVKHDGKIVVCNDVIFKIKGISVFYTPYFSHTSPRIKRLHGFLVPQPWYNKTSGYFMKLSYFYPISQDKDLLFSVAPNTKTYPMIGASYRNRFHNGNSSVNVSAIKIKKFSKAIKKSRQNLIKERIVEKKDVPRPISHKRWGFKCETDFQPSDKVRFSSVIHRASDIYYNNDYPATNKFYTNLNIPSTSSYLKLERIDSPEFYFSISSHAFQTSMPKKTPFVAPIIEAEAQKEIFSKQNSNLFFSTDSQFINLYRERGLYNKYSKGLQRIANISSFKGNSVLLGNVFDYEVGFSFSLYNIQKYSYGNALWSTDKNTTRDIINKNGNTAIDNITKNEKSYSKVKSYPFTNIKWSYPLISSVSSGGFYTVISPVASLTFIPKDNNSFSTPNEDSNYMRLDETNLFSAKRVVGFDKHENGLRKSIGIEEDFYFGNKNTSKIFLGKAFYNSKEYQWSDGVVGSFQTSFNDSFQIRYRALLDDEMKIFKYSEVGIRVPNICKWELEFAHAYFLEDQDFQSDYGEINNKTKHIKITNKERRMMLKASQIHWKIKTPKINGFNAFFAQIIPIKRNKKTLNRKDNKRTNEKPFVNDKKVNYYAGAGYENECVAINVGMQKSFEYGQVKLTKDTKWYFGVMFKTLGEIPIGKVPQYISPILSKIS